MNNKRLLFISIILMLLMITISSASAGELDTAEDMTISEELSIDNGDTIDLDEELIEDNAILSDNEELDDNENVGASENSEEMGNNITPSGNSFTAIQNAINSASDGDNIILNGTYYQDTFKQNSGFYSTISKEINVTKRVNIIGINNATLKGVILQSNRIQFGLMRILADGVVLKNISFCDGRTVAMQINGADVGYAGGVFCQNHYFSMENCRFLNNCIFDSSGDSVESSGALKLRNSDCNITNCYFSDSKGQLGGAILIRGNSTVKLYNSTFEDNYVSSNGGAVCVLDNAHTDFINCYFISNSASNGGAIYDNRESFSYDIINCSFTNNSANNEGGAIWLGNTTSVKISDSSFESNTAMKYGGAVCAKYCEDTSIENCSFVNNSANQYGGAVDGVITLANCSFVKNSAYRGGAIEGIVDCINCSFVNNSASDSAGALWTNGDGSIVDCSFENNSARYNGAVRILNDSLFNCSFVNNSAVNYGGAISVYDGTLVNCSFVNNSAENNGGAIAISGSSSTINDCSFVNNSAGDNGGAIFSNLPFYLENSYFETNRASVGGAISVGGSSSAKGLTIFKCGFVNNSATNAGGAICINDGSDYYKISNCTFDGNAVVNESQGDYRFGGAIYCLANACEIINSNFNNNTSPDAGGAIYICENTASMAITNCAFNSNLVFNDFHGVNRGGGAICSLSNGLNISRSSFIFNNALSSFGGAVRLINPNNGVFNSSIKSSTFSNNNALYGLAVYTDDGTNLILNEFRFNIGENESNIVYGLSVENLTESFNTYTESKWDSSISPTNKTFDFGEAIIIPVSSENVANITVTILDGDYQVVFTKEGVVANGEFVVPNLPAGTYTVNYVGHVIEEIFNPSYAGSRLTINTAKSSVSASAVTSYYGKTFSVKVSSSNATGVKYTIKNSKGTAVKSGTINAGASITGLKFAPGTYTVSLTAVVDGNHSSSSASSKITVKKSTATITAKALTTYYASGKKWSIKLLDKTNNKAIASQKITVRVYTGKKYKNYTVKTNSKGIATFTVPKALTVGTHKVIVTFSHSYYTCKSVTTKIKVNKHKLTLSIGYQKFEDGSRTIDILVRDKYTNKPVNKMKLKVLIYTGSKVTKKYTKLVSGYYKYNMAKGFAMYGGGIKAFGKAGTHKIKVIPNDSRYTGSSNVVKISVPKSAKNIKTVVISKGKLSYLK